MKNELHKTKDGSFPAKPSLWTSNFLFIFFSTLSIVFAFQSLNPTLPLYVEQFGGTVQMAGLPLASLTVAAIICRPITGWALDKYGRKRILLAGIILFLLPMGLFISLIPVMLLIIFRFVQGIGWGISNTAAGTVASDVVPLERMGEGMGYFGFTMSISMAFSSVMALWLVEKYTFRELFLVCTILCVVSLLLAMLVKYPETAKTATAPTRFVFMEKTALKPAAVIFLLMLAYSAIISFLPLYARDQGLLTTGYFFTAMAASSLLCRPFAGKYIDQAGKKGYDAVVLIGMLASIGAMPILARTSSLAHLLCGGALFGVAVGSVQPAMLALSIVSTSPEKRGGANATFWTAVDIGAAIGSLFWGCIAFSFGYKVLFDVAVIPLCIALILYFFWPGAAIKSQEAGSQI